MSHYSDCLWLVVILRFSELFRVLDCCMNAWNSLCSVSGKIVVCEEINLAQIVIYETLARECSEKIERDQISSSELCSLTCDDDITALSLIVCERKLVLLIKVKNSQRRINLTVWSKFRSDSQT